MNDHDRTTPEADAPQKSQPKLQTLDLAALCGIGDVLDAMVCDIDDPDCEAPNLVQPPIDDRRHTEVIDDPPRDS